MRGLNSIFTAEWVAVFREETTAIFFKYGHVTRDFLVYNTNLAHVIGEDAVSEDIIPPVYHISVSYEIVAQIMMVEDVIVWVNYSVRAVFSVILG